MQVVADPEQVRQVDEQAVQTLLIRVVPEGHESTQEVPERYLGDTQEVQLVALMVQVRQGEVQSVQV